MTEWFRTAFGAEYLSLYAHRDDAEAQQAVQLILSTCTLPAGASVLDAPCGNGRHARAFANAGLQCVGLDLSSDLLDVAQSLQTDGNPSILRADLRAIPLRSDSFDLVANLFSSFGYLETDADNFAVMLELARVCTRKGYIVIDFMNASHVQRNLEPETTRRSPGGCEVHERRWISSHPRRVNKETIALSRTGEQKQFFESVRLYEREELLSLMNAAHLESIADYGDYDGSSYLTSSPRCILIGRKSG